MDKIKVCFYAQGNQSVGSFRIPFIGFHEHIKQISKVEIIDPENVDQADFVFCLPGQGIITKIDNLNSDVIIISFKPHYEIGYRFDIFNDLQGAIRSVFRLLRPRRYNRAYIDHISEVNKSNILVADSRKILRHYKSENRDSVFIRLVENIPITYSASSKRLPNKGEKLYVCYHGNPNLYNLSYKVFRNLLNKLSDLYDVHLYVVTNTNAITTHLDNCKFTCEYVDYNFDTLCKILTQTHFGLVPDKLSISNDMLRKVMSMTLFGGYQDNLDIMAEKFSSNAGRAYLFAQFGIPFIATSTEEIALEYGEIYSEVGFVTSASDWEVILNYLLSSQNYANISNRLCQISKTKLSVSNEVNRLLDTLVSYKSTSHKNNDVTNQ
jgi:hypothetical protein